MEYYTVSRANSSIHTSFLWWHKILDAIRSHIGIINISKVIEAYQKSFLIFYKNNHSKNSIFTISWKSYKQGPKSKPWSQEDKKKRCIPKNQVSVIAFDRIRNVILELVCNCTVKIFNIYHHLCIIK